MNKIKLIALCLGIASLSISVFVVILGLRSFSYGVDSFDLALMTLISVAATIEIFSLLFHKEVKSVYLMGASLIINALWITFIWVQSGFWSSAVLLVPLLAFQFTSVILLFHSKI